MKSASIVLLFCIFFHTIINGAHHYYSSNSQAVQDSYEKNNRKRPFHLNILNKRRQWYDFGQYGQADKKEADEENEPENETNEQENEENIQENEESNQEKEEVEQEYDIVGQVIGNVGTEESDGDEELKNDEDEDSGNDEDTNEVDTMNNKKQVKGPPQYKYELKNGDMADMFGTNQHNYIPLVYTDFGHKFRRVLQQILDSERRPSNADAEAEASLDQAVKDSLKDVDVSNYLVPRKAPPEQVLSIAKKAALLAAAKPNNPADDLVHRDILRSGHYWNGVWKEDIVTPKKILRTNKKSSGRYKELQPELETVKVKIMPGSKLHDLVSMTKDISPKLLYIINNKENL